MNTVPTFAVKVLKRASQRNLRGNRLFRILYPPISSINETPGIFGEKLLAWDGTVHKQENYSCCHAVIHKLVQANISINYKPVHFHLSA